MLHLRGITEAEHNVLIVDRDQSRIEKIISALRNTGYILDTTTNEKIAIKKLKDSFYDVLIFNYTSLPDNGKKFLEELKTKSPNTVPLATTEKYDENLESLILEEGVYNIHGGKHIRPARLRADVRNAISLIKSAIDHKTGFYNSYLLFQRINEQINSILDRRTNIRTLADRRKNNYCLSILLIDFDNFKKINDTYGHIEGGDVVLTSVADEIRKNTRPTDIYGRYGGDELVVGIPGLDYKKALGKAEIIRDRIENKNILSKSSRIINATVTIGLVTVPCEGVPNNVESIISAADKALYFGKRELKKNVVVGYLELPLHKR